MSTPTFTDLVTARRELIRRVGTDEALKVLRKIGANDLRAIEPERRAAVIAAIETAR